MEPDHIVGGLMLAAAVLVTAWLAVPAAWETLKEIIRDDDES